MDLIEIEENKNNIVVKHQELVHNARYRLSELGIKVVSVLISMIKVSDADFKEYNIRINDFKELVGSSSKNTYEYVDVMTDELMKKPFKIGDEKFNWVYFSRYHNGDNYVTLKIAPELKPYLLALQGNFLKYNITNILPLKSGYVIRLYELCKDHFAEGTRYKKEKQSIVFKLDIERLRELFEIPKSYRYNDIKRHILDKAVKQFQDKTDIQISYTEDKIGRKVDRLLITVKENDKGSNDYLTHRTAFIKHMRANYINKDVLASTNKENGKAMMLSIAPDGKLYDKRGTDFDAERSNEMWDKLFEMAKEDILQCLKQDTLFDDTIEQISTGVEKKANHNHAVKAKKILSIEELVLDDKFINFAKSTNLENDEIQTEFLMFCNHHKSIETEPNRNWFKNWCGWISNGNRRKR